MIIVDPDEVVGFVTLDYFVCKNAILFDVSFPAFSVKIQLRREVVKHGPEGLIGIAFVESGGYLLRQVNRETSFFLRPLDKNRAPFGIVLFCGIPGPANPVPSPSSEEGLHGARQSTRTSGRRPTCLSSLQRQWESVRDHNEACVLARTLHWKSGDRL